jgi:hypothetical protein
MSLVFQVNTGLGAMSFLLRSATMFGALAMSSSVAQSEE